MSRAIQILNLVGLLGLYGLLAYAFWVVRRRDIYQLTRASPKGLSDRMDQLEVRMDRFEVIAATLTTIRDRVEQAIVHFDGGIRTVLRVSENVTTVGEKVSQLVQRLEENESALKKVCVQLETALQRNGGPK